MKNVFVIFLVLILQDSFSQENKNSEKADVDQYIKEATVTKYLVLAGVSNDFNALDNLAKQISKKTGIKYENGLEYDKKRGMIVPDTSSDVIYAGSYFPRRDDDEKISIEMLWYYKNEQNDADSSRQMIIITGIFGNKKNAETQLNSVKSIVPSAYIKKKGIFMGCMH